MGNDIGPQKLACSSSTKGKPDAPGFVLDPDVAVDDRGHMWMLYSPPASTSAHLGDRDLPLLAIADSWLPSLPDPPASRIVVASLFIGWDPGHRRRAGDVWPKGGRLMILEYMGYGDARASLMDANLYLYLYLSIHLSIYPSIYNISIYIYNIYIYINAGTF